MSIDCPTSTCEIIGEDDGNGRCVSLSYWAKGAHGWLLVNYWDGPWCSCHESTHLPFNLSLANQPGTREPLHKKRTNQTNWS